VSTIIQRFDSEVDGCKLIHLTALVRIGLDPTRSPQEVGVLVTVGTVTLSPQDWHFKQFFVEKEFRAQGIGSAMLAAMIEIADRNAAFSISCAVDPKNNDARNWYLARGFVPVYRFGDGDTLMARVLDAGTVIAAERLKVTTEKHGAPKFEWS
jgi:GNAT superfamily N-acetyltransferase